MDQGEEIVALLREIRDTQKVHLERYQDAIKNQNAAIAMQKKQVLLQRGFVIVFVVILAYFAFTLRH